VNPKTRLPFSVEENKQISTTRSHNLLHNSAKAEGSIRGVSLPAGKASLNDYRVEELKAMVIA